jgi:nucleoside-diphosphate-sugar epimerase
MGEYDPTVNVKIPEGFFRFIRKFRLSKKSLFPRRPGSFYHASKVASTYYIDLACRAWGTRATDIMQGIVFGAWTRESDDHDTYTRLDIDEAFGTVMNRFILQAHFDQPLTIYGSGDHQRGFLSLYDSIQCLNIALNNPPKKSEYRTWNQLFLTLTMNEVADIVIDAAGYYGRKAYAKYIPSPRTEHTNEHYYNPETKILKNLGYIPNIDTPEAIRDEIWHIFGLLKINPPDPKLIDVIQKPQIKWR